MPEGQEKLSFPRFPFLDLPCLQVIPRTIFVKPGGHSPVEFPVLPSHDSPFLFPELPTPESLYKIWSKLVIIKWNTNCVRKQSLLDNKHLNLNPLVTSYYCLNCRRVSQNEFWKSVKNLKLLYAFNHVIYMALFSKFNRNVLIYLRLWYDKLYLRLWICKGRKFHHQFVRK